MDPVTIGQQVKAKYPQYQGMSDAEVGQKVLAKYPQYGTANQAQQAIHPDSTAVNLMRDIPGGSTMADLMGIAQAPGTMVRQATNNYGMGGDTSNKFFTNDQKQGFQKNPLQQLLNSGTSDVASSAMGAGTVFSLAALAPYLTQGGRAELTAKRAGESDVVTDATDLMKKAQEAAQTKFGTPQSQEAVKQWFIDHGFLGNGEVLAGETPQMTMQDVLQGRKWAGADYTNPISQVVQRTMSENLHQNVPSTQLPDYLYHVGAQMDAPAILRLLGGGAGLVGLYQLLSKLK